MHRTDSADYVTNSGKRQFKDSPTPGTTFSSNEANAWQEELCNLIEAVGITLAASSAADQAAGWTQVLQAVRRASTRLVPLTHNMTSATELLTPNYDYFAYYITEASSYVNGQLTVDWDPNYDGQLYVIINKTTSTKLLLNPDGSLIVGLPAGKAVMLHGEDDAGDMRWRALGPQWESATKVCRLYRANDTTNLSAVFDVAVRVDHTAKLTHMQVLGSSAGLLPSIVMSGADDEILLMLDGVGTLPNQFFPEFNTLNGKLIAVGYASDGASLAEPVAIKGGNGALIISRFNASNFPTGTTIVLSIPNLTFIHNS